MPVNDRNDPGVPEALPRTLVRLVEAVGAERLDGLWIFPPLIKGRREWGLVVASCFAGEGTRRSLYTARYAAERTGRGLDVQLDIAEQGEAPPDRFPRVVDGVVRRSGTELGDPREVLINGDADAVQELMDEFDPALLETVES
jgi:hypothetical protein